VRSDSRSTSLHGGQLIAELAPGTIIYLLDSMSAVDAMWAGGAPAVAPPLHIQSGQWLPAYTDQLRGFNVVMIPSSGFPSSSSVKDRSIFRALTRGGIPVRMTPPPGDGAFRDALTYIEHHSVADLVKWALDVPPLQLPHRNGKVLPKMLEGVFTAKELASMDIPPPQWLVPDLLPEGCVILAGRPKTGKSWLALNIALAVSLEAGVFLGRAVVGTGTVLYFALEDTKGRLQRRMDQLEPDRAKWPDRFHFLEDTRPGPEVVLAIDAWCQERTEAGDTIRLIVVDTLGRMRRSPKAHASVYHEDLEAIAPLHTLAKRWHCVVLLVDHQRKAAAEDIFDSVTGSLAKTGTVDGTWILERERGADVARLWITGRDIVETDFALSFDVQRGLWNVVAEDEALSKLTAIQRQILKAMEPSGTPMLAGSIAAVVGLNSNQMTRQLRYLERDRLITRFTSKKWILGKPEDLPDLQVLPDPDGQGRSGSHRSDTSDGSGTGAALSGTTTNQTLLDICPSCGAFWPGPSAITCTNCEFTGRCVAAPMDSLALDKPLYTTDQ
jgi:hypothetical protein